MTRTEATGTVRDPDGVPSAAIDGLVVRAPAGGLHELTKQQAIERANRGELWCRGPSGQMVDIIVVNGHLQTKPDGTRQNNLLALDIWDRKRRIWLDSQGRVKAA